MDRQEREVKRTVQGSNTAPRGTTRRGQPPKSPHHPPLPSLIARSLGMLLLLQQELPTSAQLSTRCSSASYRQPGHAAASMALVSLG